MAELIAIIIKSVREPSHEKLFAIQAMKTRAKEFGGSSSRVDLA
ncbi:hypothetical protein [Nitrospira sp. KM1]|nr:hypothetical protein [Nitrospira sp. KM1]